MLKKIIAAPDSFKGTVKAEEFCEMTAAAAEKYYPDCETVMIPVADGGEGTVDAFLKAAGGSLRKAVVSGPFGEKITAGYAVLEDGTAVVETASEAGLPMVSGREDPEKTTTYGVGELISRAVVNGAKKIIIGLGGSCTNDAAAGCLSAMGVKFFDKDGKAFLPTGGTLCKISGFDDTEYRRRFADVEITAMCDIDNPFYGPKGASYVFAPQKGADGKTVASLDEGLRHFAEIIKREKGVDLQNVAGAGAAGGMGGGLYAFGASLKRGIDVVLDTAGFDKALGGADLVFTGEGKIDSQSLGGKVVVGVAKRAKKAGVPVVAVVGDIGENMEPVYDLGVSLIYSTNRVAVPFSLAKLRSKKDLELTLDNIMRSIKIFGKIG